eukprot:jgi/Astpho2/9392/fgenesh1_pg.00145_%23_17_t
MSATERASSNGFRQAVAQGLQVLSVRINEQEIASEAITTKLNASVGQQDPSRRRKQNLPLLHLAAGLALMLCCCLQNRLQETLETMTRDTSKLLRQLTERLASASEETSKKIGGLQELHEKIPELVSQQLSQLGSQLTSLNQAASTFPALEHHVQELNECQNRSVATEEEHRQDIDTLKEMNLAVKTQVQALERSMGQPGLLQQVSDSLRRLEDQRLENQLAPRLTALETAADERQAASIATEDTMQQLSARVTAMESAPSQQQLQHMAERERAEAELHLQQRMRQEQQAWREEVEIRAKAQSDLALERMARQMDGRVADVQRQAAGRTAELQTQVASIRGSMAVLHVCICGMVNTELREQVAELKHAMAAQQREAELSRRNQELQSQLMLRDLEARLTAAPATSTAEASTQFKVQLETQKMELQQHTLKLEQVQEQVVELQQSIVDARSGFQQTGQATAQVEALPVQRRVAALEAQVRQQAHHLEQARHREVRLQQDMVDTKAAGERATATAEEAKADAVAVVGDLDDLEAAIKKEAEWLAQYCTFKDGVDPQVLLDIISFDSDGDDSPPGDHHPRSPSPGNRQPGAGRSAGDDGWDGSPQEGEGAQNWVEGASVRSGGADVGGRGTGSADVAEHCSPAGRQESVGNGGGDATPPGSVWEEPQEACLLDEPAVRGGPGSAGDASRSRADKLQQSLKRVHTRTGSKGLELQTPQQNEDGPLQGVEEAAAAARGLEAPMERTKVHSTHAQQDHSTQNEPAALPFLRPEEWMDTPEYKCYCKPLSEMGWTITEQLGEGGQAVVYRGTNHGGATKAFKCPKLDAPGGPDNMSARDEWHGRSAILERVVAAGQESLKANIVPLDRMHRVRTRGFGDITVTVKLHKSQLGHGDIKSINFMKENTDTPVQAIDLQALVQLHTSSS